MLICFSISAFATDENTATFTLAIWAPDEVPPHNAKHVEIGNSYYYRYTPEEILFESNQNRKLNIEFHESFESRYQFRWVTATSPSDVTLLTKSDSLIKIAVDDGDDVSDSIYIEVWVYATLTGERFMADPQYHNRPPDAQ
ncbi:hypothetical protein D210916BOD24_09630 [Alteromonas sp. D210916BOD_24]|uniref:hypothetical protein n=1 Tax=Alteromonas sp. D210916BOD_24 TaxID=3157618 RepID=UPI00399CFD6C